MRSAGAGHAGRGGAAMHSSPRGGTAKARWQGVRSSARSQTTSVLPGVSRDTIGGTWPQVLEPELSTGVGNHADLATSEDSAAVPQCRFQQASPLSSNNFVPRNPNNQVIRAT